MAVVQSWWDPINQTLGYVADQCTAFVANALSWIPAGLGNAQDWLSNAQAKGLPTGQAPQVGSVAVWSGSQVGNAFGHVAEVVGLLPGGGIQVAEENWLGAGQADIRNVTGAQLPMGYIYPPGSGSGSGLTLPGLGQLPGIGTGSGSSIISSGIEQATADMLTQVGHGLAGAASASAANLGIFAKNHIVELAVALVVVLALFGGNV